MNTILQIDTQEHSSHMSYCASRTEFSDRTAPYGRYNPLRSCNEQSKLPQNREQTEINCDSEGNTKALVASL